MADKTICTTFPQPPALPVGAPGERLTMVVLPNGTIEAFYGYAPPDGSPGYDHPGSLRPANGSGPANAAHACFVAARPAVWGAP